MITEEQYEPYGEEWKAEMMKMSKRDILNFFASVGKKRLELEEELKSKS